jgi:hypothetical protein
MKSKGIKPKTTPPAEAPPALSERAQLVAAEIRRAFRGVTLRDGVGLQQAQGLDDYAEPEELKRYRADDEKDDWQKIPSQELRRCGSSLSFFDADGMRFHLPAFLIAELREDYGIGLNYYLTEPDEFSRSKFATLDGPQKQAVLAYLRHCLEDPSQRFDHPGIQRALGYWNEPPVTSKKN